MALNNNTWYSIQSLNTFYFLSASIPSGDGGNISAGSSSSGALWQVFQPNEQVPAQVLRPQAHGPLYCMVNSGIDYSPTLQLCSNGSYSSYWYPEYSNGVDESDGWLISATWEIYTTEPLYLDPNSSILLVSSDTDGTNAQDVGYQWTFSSVSAINDPSWSQTPTVTYSSATSTPFPTTTNFTTTTESSSAVNTSSIFSTSTNMSSISVPVETSDSSLFTDSSIIIPTSSSTSFIEPTLTSTEYVTVTSSPPPADPITSTVIVTLSSESSLAVTSPGASVTPNTSLNSAPGLSNPVKDLRKLDVFKVVVLAMIGAWLVGQIQ